MTFWLTFLTKNAVFPPLLLRLVGHWTAPGGDYDAGNVSGYRFVYSPSPFAFRGGEGGAPDALTSFASKDKAAGSAVTYSFTFDKYEKDYHVAVVAFDEAGNVGNYSNVVRVRLATPTDPTGGPPTGPTGNCNTENQHLISYK